MNKIKYFALIISISAITALCGCQTGNATNEEAVTDNEINEEKQEASDDVGPPKENEVSEARDMTPPVEKHGKLSVEGTQIVDAGNEAFQIKGVSTHGLMWFPEYVNIDAFRTIRDDWNANCIRLAMYTGEGGYCSGASKDSLKELVCNGVDYATELGMYAIIDWHILKDNDPNMYVEESKAFFEDMSKKYGDNDNVLYEICNEPNSGTEWSRIKEYALQVIPVIRANDPDAIVIVGTPNWSQDVDVAANDPITGFDNIMYAIHFYADTHKDDLRYKMKVAQNKGLPIFCSEFGICDASGNGAINTYQADKWISLLNDRGISYCIWNLSNKNESSSLIKAGNTKLYGWGEDELSDEAKWYLGVLGGKAGTTQVNEPQNDTEDDEDINLELYDGAKNPGLLIKVDEDNSWNDGKADYKQLRITLTNTGKDRKQWNIEYSLDGDYEIDQSWGGEFSISGNMLVIRNADYNGEIKKGESLSDIGVIIRKRG